MILTMESVQITCLQMLKPFHSDVCSRLNRFASSPCTVLEAAILIGDVRRYYVTSTSSHCDVIERHRFDACRCCENTVWIFASRFISHVLNLITVNQSKNQTIGQHGFLGVSQECRIPLIHHFSVVSMER